jgi:superfamily II DNA helicase RecQ
LSKAEPSGKSGIVFVTNRKTAEDVAQSLVVNGIKAALYHAGIDNKTRTSTQDKFLMEELDVIVATIAHAFGMGIDKPDIRFVIHFDVPLRVSRTTIRKQAAPVVMVGRKMLCILLTSRYSQDRES